MNDVLQWLTSVFVQPSLRCLDWLVLLTMLPVLATATVRVHRGHQHEEGAAYEERHGWARRSIRRGACLRDGVTGLLCQGSITVLLLVRFLAGGIEHTSSRLTLERVARVSDGRALVVAEQEAVKEMQAVQRTHSRDHVTRTLDGLESETKLKALLVASDLIVRPEPRTPRRRWL
nr:hypothetical protein KRP22_1020 [Phytophthora ramorum]